MPNGTRTPADIAKSRALEAFAIVGIPAVILILTMFAGDLSKCTPNQAQVFGSASFLGCSVDVRAIAIAAMLAIITPTVQYLTAFQTALHNQVQNGTTAPLGTVAAPNTFAANGQTTIVAKPT